MTSAIAKAKQDKDTTLSSVKVPSNALALIRMYSEKTGIPATRVIEDMTIDWMSTVGQARIEAMDSTRGKLSNLITLPVKGGVR